MDLSLTDKIIVVTGAASASGKPLPACSSRKEP